MHSMHLSTILIFMLVTLFNTTIAQDAPPSYGPAITLEQAKKVAAAAEAEAKKNKWNVYIVVVDSSTNVVLMQRMDDAQLGSLNVAQKKAFTAAAFKRSTKVFEDGIAKGGVGMRILGNDQAMPIEGGLPIFVNGKIVGAIGVSGVTSEQDGIIAKAGVEALK
jgi:glc operon protein GlcG